MTASSTSEPELETQPAKPGPTETVDLTSKDAPPEVEAAAESADQDEPAAQSPADPKPVSQAEPADLETDVPAPIENAADLESVADLENAADLEDDAQGQVEERADDQDEEWTDEDYQEILDAEPSDRYRTLIPLIGSLLGLTAITALMLVSFALPAVKSAPHRLPIGVAGSAEFQTEVKSALTEAKLKPFAITSYGSESKLRAAIEDHKIYGGLNLDATNGISMLVSSAASPVAAATLSSLAGSLTQDGQMPVTDVVKLPASDVHGDGLAAANLPLVIAAVLPALLLIPLYRRRPGARLGATAGAAVLVGLGLSAVLDHALGSTNGSNFLLVSVGLMAGVLATSLLLLGLFAVGRLIAVAVGAALLVLFAAPLSGLSTAPEWLPTPWGAIGQLMPPGANATLLRSTAYFDGRGGAGPTLVLAAWALIGLLLLGVGALITRSQAVEPDVELLEVTL